MDRPAPDPSEAAQAAPPSGDSLGGRDSTIDRSRIGAAVAEELRQRWQHGERVRAEAYFQSDPELARDEEAALDVIYGEFLVRSEHGETPSLDEYLTRFPQFAGRLQFLLAFDDVVCDLIRSHSSTSHAAPPLEPAAVVIGGKYRVIELLDRGGQAEVYRAVHLGLRRDVVIKLSRRAGPRDAADCAGFLAEGRILAELEHPNLAAVYDLDFHEGRPFLAMEYVPGRTLEQYARGRSLPAAEAVRLVAQAARAVAVAHGHGVVHRDIKPKNILIDERGRPRVIDFGLAQMHAAWRSNPAADDRLSGTLPFMPPEQAADPPAADTRTDVFALGAVLYYLLTGRPLYSGDDMADLLAKARRCAYDRQALEQPTIPPRLRTVCLKALAADPHERYANAAALADDLDALVRPSRRWWWAAGLLAVLLLTAAAIGWPRGKPASYDDTKPTLTVEVRDNRPGAAIRKLFARPSPPTGSAVKVIVNVPDGFTATLFHIDSHGTLHKLAARASDSHAALIAPSDGTSFTLTGAGPATELLIAVGRSRGPAVDLDELRDSLAGIAMPLPALPDGEYLRLLRGKVEWEPEQPRGLEPGPAPRNGPCAINWSSFAWRCGSGTIMWRAWRLRIASLLPVKWYNRSGVAVFTGRHQMRLLDHFHPPLEDEYPWDSLHSGWATRLADLLNERCLSPQFIAAEHTHGEDANGLAVATVTPAVWTPPAAEATIAALFPDAFEVRVFRTRGGRTLFGAIELIGPRNKDRGDARQAFAEKCATYLRQGVSVVIIDIVTHRRANLHNEVMRVLQAPEGVDFPSKVYLYAAAYRPVQRQERAEIERLEGGVRARPVAADDAAAADGRPVRAGRFRGGLRRNLPAAAVDVRAADSLPPPQGGVPVSRRQ